MCNFFFFFLDYTPSTHVALSGISIRTGLTVNWREDELEFRISTLPPTVRDCATLRPLALRPSRGLNSTERDDVLSRLS